MPQYTDAFYVFCGGYKFDRAPRKISRDMRFLGVRFRKRLWKISDMARDLKFI